jgi:hypothetical protein
MEYFLSHSLDYLSNKIDRYVPWAATFEIISRDAINWCHQNLTSAEDREYTANYIKDRPEQFKGYSFVWDEITLPVKYGSDAQLAGELILGAARHELAAYAGYAREHWKRMVKIYLIEDAHVEPTLTMQLTDNWIAFNLRYVVDYKKRRSTKHQLYSEIRQAIGEAQGKVELASATFELVGWPDMNVRLSEPGK